ncbi:MAG: NADH-quinone oxidoreductase subunit J [Verrucomicrobia bacterium]|nr:NADH-quinone oxidoreductase subunit J [Verrucomicrobiota bacterium]MCF7708468.1 NADH-quinone oxidoreductase subunit J [Verrucomicrobiota bacterium]
MYEWLFYIFAGLMLVSGFMVVANPFTRSPVASAMFLVVAIVSMAGLFVMLNAFFLAAVQVIVYAGAVVVMFLFVIMLLNPVERSRRRGWILGVVSALLAPAALVLLLLKAFYALDGGDIAETPVLEGGARELGELLFSAYVLPFEVVSVLLLAAIVGVVVLNKRETE